MKKNALLLLLLLCIGLNLSAQVSSYTFSYSSGTYTPLSGGTAVVPPNSGLSGNGWFEQVYNVPLPFVYYFKGAGYSSVFVNSNGHLSFAAPTLPTNPRPHTVNNGQAGAIMGYGCAVTYQYSGGAGGVLLGGLLDNTNANPIYYGTIGTAPNRIFVVQWTSCTRSVTYWGYGGPSDALTFQIRLKETSNVAELVYGSSTTAYSPAYNAVVGLSGASTADFNLVGGSSWTSVTNNTSTTATNIPFTTAVSIPAGTTYDFTPSAGQMPVACSGTPSAAATLSTSGIATGPITLSLSGLPLATGLTYQWQSSPTGLANSWANISGATNATCTLTPTAAAYYICLVACGGGTQVASSAIAVGYESSYPGLPSYAYFSASGYPNENIGQFQIAGGACGSALNDLNNSVSNYNYTGYQTCCGTSYTYVDYTNRATHIQLQGSPTSSSGFTATYNNYGGSYAAVVGVWIDFNDNGVFTDANEYVGSVTGVAGTATTFTLTIPANNFGIHRMRVRTANSTLGYTTGSITPTGALNYFGQANDYMVEILPPTPAPTSNSPVCVNGVLTLTSPTVAGSTIYTWTGPLSYYATTTSTTQNYIVTSTSASGTYNLYTTVDGSNACTSSGSASVTVNPQPALTSATNSGPICAGNNLSLTANGATNVTGYSWTGPGTITSATSATASVNAAPATASGIYTVTVNNGTGSGCSLNYTTTAVVTAQPNVSAFSTSVANGCIGNPATVTITSASLTAGVYTVNYNITGANTSLGNTATITMSGSTGTFSTVSLGNSGSTTITINSITSSATGCVSNLSSGNTFVFNVNPLPSAISGTPVVCAGLTTTLSDAGGGTWASNNTAIATVVSGTGIVTGVSGGTTTITYTLPTACSITTPITVNQTPAITGVAGTCVGNTTTLSDITGGGSWSSNNISVATVGAGTGIVTGITLGSCTISYTLPSTGCSATQLVNITSSPSLFTVTGGGNYCIGATALHVGLNSSTIGVGYQLSISGVPTGSIISGTGGAIDFGPQVTAGLYTVTANPGTSCAATMTGSVAISILPVPTAYSVTGGGSYCAGSGGVHVYLSGSNTGISYQLYNSGLSTGSPVAGTSGIIDFGVFTSAGTYTAVATNSVTSCVNNMTGSVIISINPLPAVFTVSGGGSYCVGGSGMPVSLSGSVIGVNYQLYQGGVAIGSPVAGTSASISFGNQTLAGTYTVIATNATTACVSNMTGSATVSIISLPLFYSVTGGGSYCSGSTGVHIGLSGSSVGTNYQLYNGPGTVGGLVAGTGSAIDFGIFTAVGTYTVVASIPASTCTNSMIGSVIVSINPPPVSFTVTGGGNYCLGTGGLHVGLNGSVIGTNYYLYNGATIVGGASGTGAPLDFGLEIAAGIYTVTATVTGTGCGGNMTGSVTISINALPTAFNVTGGGSYCSGAAAPHVLLSSSTSGVSYQLMNGTTPVGTAMAGTGSSLDFGVQPAAGTYTVIATITATGCMNTMNGSVTVVANPLPSGYTVSGGGYYCTGGTGVHVNINNSDAGVNYQLKLGIVSAGTPVAGTGSALDFGLVTTAGTYTVIATNAVTGCSSTMPGSATVGILLLPTVYNVTGGGSYCTGGSGRSIGLSNSDAGVSYQLYNGTVAVGAAIAGSGSALDFGLQTVAGTYTVKATNLITGCINNMSGSVIISVNPLPAANTVTGGGNYCTGGTGVHIGLNGSVSGVNYQIFNGGSPVGGLIPGTGSPIDFGLFTSSGTYTVVGTNAVTTCLNTMTGSATVGANPLPVMHSVTGGGSFTCAGGIGLPVSLDGSNTGTNYQLYRSGVLVGTPVPGTGLALDYGLQTVGGSYSVVATTVSTGCSASMLSGVSITVIGSPASHTVTGGGNYCPGSGGVTVGLNGSNTGVIYQLYINGLASGSPIAGTTSALSFGLQTTPGNYSVVAADPITGCSAGMAGVTTVAMSALPLVYNITGGGSYCIGSTGSHIYLNGSTSGVSYALYNAGVLTTTVVAGTGSPLDFGLQPAGTYTIKGTSTSTGCINTMTGSASVTANPLPVQYAVAGGGLYCAGGAGSDITLGGSESGVYYQLSLSGSTVGVPVYGTGTSIDMGLQTATGMYSVIATNSSTGCTNTMTGTSTVGNYPAIVPYTVTGGGNYCASGTGVHILLNGSTTGVTYQLYVGSTATGVPLFGTGLPLDFGSQTVTGNYTVIGTDIVSLCAKTMTGSATVGTYPLPATYNVTGGGAICAVGSGAHIYLSGSSSGVSYQLYNSGILSGSSWPGTGSAIDFGLLTTAGAYTVKATDNVTGCNINMTGTATINTGSVPVAYTVTGSSSTGYCSGGSGVAIYLSNSEAGVNYQLYRGTTAVGAPVAGISGSMSFGSQTIVGNYTVSAVNISAGCTNNMAGSVSVTINPKPTSFNVTGGGGICSGGSRSLGLSGSATGINYQVYHSGVAIGSVVSGTGFALDLGAQTLTGSYSVIAMNTSTGCINTMTGTATIYTNPAPTAYSMTGGGNFCSGSTGVHVGLNSSASGFSYQLYKGIDLVGSALPGTGASLDFGIQTVSGLYTTLATNNATGCTAIMTGGANVTAVPLPVVHPVSGGGSYCAGDAGVHIGLSGSATGVNYRLYKGSTLMGSPIPGSGLAIDFGYQTAAGSYTVVATEASLGCVNNMSGSAIVAINALPDVYPVNGGGSYCDGTGGVHVGLSGSAIGMNYTLYHGVSSGSTVAGTGTILDFGNQTLAGSYTVKATNPATGCTSAMAGSATVTSNSVVVPTVSISTTGGDTVCSGNLTTFTASLSNGGSAPSFQWSVNGVNTGSSISYSYIPVNGDVVGLILTSNATCATPVSVNTSAAITVWAKQTPGISISANPGIEVCQGTPVTFSATSVYGGASPSYSWLKGGIPVGSGSTYTYTPAPGDVISCKLNSNYTCRLLNTVTSAPANMVVDIATVPVVSISAYPGLNIAEGQPLTLEATVTNGGPAPTYQWAVNGTNATGATLPAFTGSTYNDGDVVSCNVTSSGGCAGLKGSNSVVVHVANVGVKPVVSIQDGIKILPNPNNGTFTISGRIGNSKEEALLEVTNMLGQVVYRNKVTADNGLIQESVQLGGSIANGMYILNVQTLNENKVFHLVVER